MILEEGVCSFCDDSYLRPCYELAEAVEVALPEELGREVEHHAGGADLFVVFAFVFCVHVVRGGALSQDRHTIAAAKNIHIKTQARTASVRKSCPCALSQERGSREKMAFPGPVRKFTQMECHSSCWCVWCYYYYFIFFNMYMYVCICTAAPGAGRGCSRP